MRNELALAKRRVALRRRDEGAVMFIVAMTLAVLASVGVYALAAAATEVRTSGNERQNTQTHYLAEYGVLGTARELTASRATQIVRRMLSTSPPPLGRDTNCVSLQSAPTTAGPMTLACVRWEGALEIGLNWTQTVVTQPYGGGTPAQPYTAGVLPGTFGSTPMNGDVFVEITEPMQAAAPNFSMGSGTCFGQFTVTSVGFTQPSFPGVINPTATFGGEGIETERARLIAGPLNPCPF